MEEKEIMSDEEALKYAVQTLQEADDLLEITDEERAELAEVIHTLSSLLDCYEKHSFGFLTLEDEDNE